MRKSVVTSLILALALAACGQANVSVNTNGQKVEIKQAADAAQAYTLEVVGEESYRVVRVKGPDGAVAAAEVVNGVSRIMDAAAAETFIAKSSAGAQAAVSAAGGEQVSINVPGFSMNVQGDGKSGDSQGQVNMSVGGTTIAVTGDEGSAVVRIGGADKDSAAKFIDEQKELSAETKAAMKAALGI